MRGPAGTGAGTGARRAAAGACLAGALTLMLSGCAGFLVPAGEGEPEPTPSRSYPPGVHADELDLSCLPTPSGRPPTGRTPRATPTPGAVATGDCPSSGVVVDMGEVQAALGHRAVSLTLTNCGRKPFRVNGYPSVRALDDQGEPLPVPVNPASSYMGTDRGPMEVMLKQGKTLTALLAWVSTPTGGDLIQGDALEIAPAPGLEARTFPLEGSDVRLLDELNMTAWRPDPPR